MCCELRTYLAYVLVWRISYNDGVLQPTDLCLPAQNNNAFCTKILHLEHGADLTYSKGAKKGRNTAVTAVLRNPFPQKCHHLVVTSTRGFILACRQLDPWCTVHFCRLEENWLLASHSWTGFQFVVYFLQICCLNKTSLAIFPFRRRWEHSYVRAFEAFACEGFSKTWQICGYINHWYFRYLDRKKCPEKLTVLTRKQWKCF